MELIEESQEEQEEDESSEEEVRLNEIKVDQRSPSRPVKSRVDEPLGQEYRRLIRPTLGSREKQFYRRALVSIIGRLSIHVLYYPYMDSQPSH